MVHREYDVVWNPISRGGSRGDPTKFSESGVMKYRLLANQALRCATKPGGLLPVSALQFSSEEHLCFLSWCERGFTSAHGVLLRAFKLQNRESGLGPNLLLGLRVFVIFRFLQ